MNSDPSVSCFNSVDVDTTYTISNELFTWGTLSDGFPYITGYKIANHGNANLATLTSTNVIVSSWCLPDPTITLPTTGPFYYDVYDPNKTIALPVWGTNFGCTDATFTYSL